MLRMEHKLDHETTNRLVKLGNLAQQKTVQQLNHNLATFNALLPPMKFKRKTLVLDLDETLVHSSFKVTECIDMIVPVEIDNKVCNVYIAIRPGCQQFLQEMSKYYELVIYTASLAKQASPLLDMLDPKNLCEHRLFREACVNQNGSQVKDLTRMGRDMADLIIVDNSPISFCLQPENAVPIRSWFDDVHDKELFALTSFLAELNKFKDVRTVLSRVAADEVAAKPATSSIALLESIMHHTKQAILTEMRKKQQSTMGTSTASQFSLDSNVPTQSTNDSFHDRDRERELVKEREREKEKEHQREREERELMREKERFRENSRQREQSKERARVVSQEQERAQLKEHEKKMGSTSAHSHHSVHSKHLTGMGNLKNFLSQNERTHTRYSQSPARKENIVNHSNNSTHSLRESTINNNKSKPISTFAKLEESIRSNLLSNNSTNNSTRQQVSASSTPTHGIKEQPLNTLTSAAKPSSLIKRGSGSIDAKADRCSSIYKQVKAEDNMGSRFSGNLKKDDGTLSHALKVRKTNPTTSSSNLQNGMNVNSSPSSTSAQLGKTAKRSSSESNVGEKRDPLAKLNNNFMLEVKKSGRVVESSPANSMKKTHTQSLLDRDSQRKRESSNDLLKSKIETELQRLKQYSSSLNKMRKK